MAFEITPEVSIRKDSAGRVRKLSHPRKPYSGSLEAAAEAVGARQPRELAEEYLREVLPQYQVEAGMATNLSAEVSGQMDDQEGPQLRLKEEKVLRDQATVLYSQTYMGLPIWEAGLAVQMRGRPFQVTGSQSSVHYEVSVELPEQDAPYLPDGIDETNLGSQLGVSGQPLTINDKRLLIYAYDAQDRGNGVGEAPPDDEQQMHVAWPTLPVPEVSSEIRDQKHYVVSEILFSLKTAAWGDTNWSAFIEPRTGSVLRLRSFVGCVDGLVYLRDPLTKTGNTSFRPSSSASVLNTLRDRVNLEGLNPPNPQTSNQSLEGEYVRMVNIESPNALPPVEPATDDFEFPVPTNDFAAVNAYYHCDRLFRMLDGMGFDVANYFNGTTFPVRVDHRVRYQNSFGILTANIVNASAPGNAAGDGSDGFRFALVERNTSVGMAVEWRVILHEFGHTILWDHVDSPNFRFAHSAGDSLAAILNDTETNAGDPGLTFPWTIITRRHDRPVAAGWAWGGSRDDPFPVGHPLSADRAGYSREQILSSTLFRLYRGTGGTHTEVAVRRFAARFVAYLIFSSIGSLTPFSQPLDAEDYSGDLSDADLGTVNFEGQPGGVVHKVIRWAFEQQGAFQPPGAPAPVTTPGDPPDVDVFINDGRVGQYDPAPEFVWTSQDIWNRRNPDAGTAHETPLAGAANSLYVRVRNRGTQAAQNVVARAFLAAPGSARLWPTDWAAMGAGPMALAGALPSGGQTVLGPFEWNPSEAGPATALVSVSTDDDPTNLDSITTPFAVQKLLHCDNNASAREMNVAPRINASGIISGASFLGGAVSPGEILSIFGNGLGPLTPVAALVGPNGTIATQLGPTRVIFDGQPAPLLFVSATQINLVAPFGIAGDPVATIQVEVDGVLSDPVDLPIQATRPGIFALDQSGSGQAAALNQDGSVNDAANPAPRDSTIAIFLTGGGATNPAAIEGGIAPLPPPFHNLSANVQVEIGGVAATTVFAGAAPALVFGVVQINATIPANVQPGGAVPVQVQIGPASSQNGITVAVS